MSVSRISFQIAEFKQIINAMFIYFLKRIAISFCQSNCHPTQNSADTLHCYGEAWVELTAR